MNNPANINNSHTVDEKCEKDFEEWWQANNYSRDCFCWDRDSFIAKELEHTFKAAWKIQEERIIELELVQTLLPHTNKVQAEYIGELENKIVELERYKQDWQSIAGKANLKALVVRLEKLEKMIMKMASYIHDEDEEGSLCDEAYKLIGE